MARSRLVAAMTLVLISHFLVRADGSNLAFLQHAQEFHLHRGRHFADLIEEDCALIGSFEQTLPICGCARERTFHIAEQLRFQQGFR